MEKEIHIYRVIADYPGCPFDIGVDNIVLSIDGIADLIDDYDSG